MDALFFGSFDPVHNGHVKMVEHLLTLPDIDKVVIVPAWRNPQKNTLTQYDNRVDMLELAFADFGERVVINKIELYYAFRQILAGFKPSTPTWEIVELLRTDNGNDFVIATTVETATSIHTWENAEYFYDKKFHVVKFEDTLYPDEIQELSKFKDITFSLLEHEDNIHSTHIRNGSNSLRRDNLPKAVFEYIYKHDYLYPLNLRNTSYTITEGEHEGETYWSGRYTAVSGIITANVNGEFYVLANKRGEGCPDYAGYWNMPCGFLERNETAEEGVAREVLEECGVNLDPKIFRLDSVETEPAFCNNGNVTLRYYATLFLDKLPEFGDTSGEENEVTDIKWIPLKDFRKYKWAFNHYDIVKNLYKESLTIPKFHSETK